MKFVKMHGCGNDYVYVSGYEERLHYPSVVAKYVSDRHFGIGADGMILICPSENADFRMEMYNSDGSEGMMCGNGIRCVAKYVYDFGLTEKKKLSIETKSGIKYLFLNTENGHVSSVTVNMGKPLLEADKIPVKYPVSPVIDVPFKVNHEQYQMTCLSMGNPHAVVFVAQVSGFPVAKTGLCFENHPAFPERTNTEFVQVKNRSEICVRVWERGSGETLACGTGACAAVVAGVLNGHTKPEVTVHLPGGDLRVFYDRNHDTVWLTGTAATVFQGEIDITHIDRMP